MSLTELERDAVAALVGLWIDDEAHGQLDPQKVVVNDRALGRLAALIQAFLEGRESRPRADTR